jgi:hypothetical protein
MNNLDDRLRTTLNELAGTVPPSPRARADLERRLARRGRRPLLIAAAAAVVVASGVVSVALSQSGNPVSGPAATAPPSVTSDVPTFTAPKPTFTLPNGDLAGPIELGRFEYEGDTLVVMMSVVAMTDGEHWTMEAYGPVDNPWPTSYSNVVPTWPADVPPGRVVKTYPVLGEQAPDSGPLPHLMVFLTSPAVTTLEVRRADGQPVTVNQIAKTSGATWFLADFAGPTEGLGFTAKDAAGNVLEDAIT